MIEAGRAGQAEGLEIRAQRGIAHEAPRGNGAQRSTSSGRRPTASGEELRIFPAWSISFLNALR